MLGSPITAHCSRNVVEKGVSKEDLADSKAVYFASCFALGALGGVGKSQGQGGKGVPSRGCRLGCHSIGMNRSKKRGL